MRKTIISLAITVAVIALLGGLFVLLFVVNKDVPVMLYKSGAAFFMDHGDADNGAKYYAKASDLMPKDVELSLLASNAAEASGNYTKAEFYLEQAIAANPEDINNYILLSKLFIREDKLLDAEKMISECVNPTVKESLIALRPEIPSISPGDVYSSVLLDCTISFSDGNLYYSLDEEYPSAVTEMYAGPIPLQYGFNRISAIVVGENGLVSPLAHHEITIKGDVTEVIFDDDKLDEYVRSLLGKQRHETIMSDELWGITELVVPTEVHDLSPIMYFAGLTSLTCTADCDDYSPLSALPNLTSLALPGSTLNGSALEIIGSLTQLTELNLAGCDIADIDFLTDLHGLKHLNLGDNRIPDITPIAGMTELEELYLQNNRLTTISPLTTVSGLVVLDVSGNTISYIGALSSASGLQELNVSSCGITDISAIENAASLRVLRAADNTIISLAPLESCPGLEILDLSSNQITDASPVSGLTELQELSLAGNTISECPVFALGSKIYDLDLSYNKLDSVEGLVGLNHLNHLEISGNRLTDLSAIANLPALVSVRAKENPLVGVASLEENEIIVSYDPGYSLADSELS